MSPQSSLKNKAYNNHYGLICTPSRWDVDIPKDVLWCADNEVFTNRFEWKRYKRWLIKMKPFSEQCIFVVAPDVVGNAQMTNTWYLEYAPRIREIGYPVAFVAQDGQQHLPFPDFDALFIGGSTTWKMSKSADSCISYAQSVGKWTHVGRVNSQRRIKHFQLVGVDSVDGTSITFAPDNTIRRLNKQLLQKPLFQLGV